MEARGSLGFVRQSSVMSTTTGAWSEGAVPLRVTEMPATVQPPIIPLD